MSEPLQCLVSVNSVEEACMVQAMGFGLIDIKNTSYGALAMLDLATTQAIMIALNRLRAQPLHATNNHQAYPNLDCPPFSVSATVGDDCQDAQVLFNHIQARVALGIDFIKLPMQMWQSQPMQSVLVELVDQACALIAVFPPDALATHAFKSHLLSLKQLGFVGVMVDTLDKQTSLTQMVSIEGLEQFVHAARQCGLTVGLAGGLTLKNFSQLAMLNADYLGFRSGLCSHQQRALALDPSLCLRLRNQLFDYYQKPLKPKYLLGAQA